MVRELEPVPAYLIDRVYPEDGDWNSWGYAAVGALVSAVGGYYYASNRERGYVTDAVVGGHNQTVTQHRQNGTAHNMPKRKRGTKYPRKRRKRRGKRKSKRAGKKRKVSSTVLKNQILSVLAAPRTLVLNHSKVVEYTAGTNWAKTFVCSVLADKWHNSMLTSSSGQDGDSFVDTSLGTKHRIFGQKQMYEIRNTATNDVWLMAEEYVCRRDYSDRDYTGTYDRTETGMLNAPNAVMQALYQSALATGNAATDSSHNFTVGDATNFRTPAEIRSNSGLFVKGRLFPETFKKVKSYRWVKIPPGETVRYNLYQKKGMALIPHYHTSVGGNHNPQMYGGRSKFLLFRVKGSIIGTSEADAGAAEDEKIARGTFQIGIMWKTVMNLKTISPSDKLFDYEEFRPGIAAANEEFVGDADDVVQAPTEI